MPKVVRCCRVPKCDEQLTPAIISNSHRVKLCWAHQRALVVECGERDMRFCQQCTRLHTLDRFDGDKRSCRDSLERQTQKRQSHLAERLNVHFLDRFCAAACLMELNMRSRKLQRQAGAEGAVDIRSDCSLKGASCKGVSCDGAGNKKRPKVGHGNQFIRSRSMVTSPNVGDGAMGQEASCPPLLSDMRMDDDRNGAARSLPLAKCDKLHASVEEGVPILAVCFGESLCEPGNSEFPAQGVHKQETSLDPERYLSSRAPGFKLSKNHRNGERAFMMDTIFERNCLATAELTEQDCSSSNPSMLSDVAWLSKEDRAQLEILSDEAGVKSAPKGHVYPVSFKFFGRTPGDLPPNMQASLISMLQVVPDMVDGAIRPGCVELTIDFWLQTEEEYLHAMENLREAILGFEDALPEWLQRANITLPDITISTLPGNVSLGPEPFQALHVLAVDAYLTGRGEAEVVLEGYYAIDEIEGLCRLNGRFYELIIFELAYDASGNTLLTVSLPVGDTGLVWIEFIVRQDSGRKSLKGTVPMVITEFFELAQEVSPHLRILWEHGRKAELAGFLKDVYVLGARDGVDAETFCSSCARLMVQATRHGWEGTLLEACDQAEAADCLKEVLSGFMPGGASLLVHAAMCGQLVMGAHVLELLRSANLIEEVSQWRDHSGITAVHWAARHPDPQLSNLLLMNCPDAVMAQMIPSCNPSTQARSSAANAFPLSQPKSISSALSTAHSSQAHRHDVARKGHETPQVQGAWLAHILSERPVLLFGCLLLLALVVIEAERSAAWLTERNVLFVATWVTAFFLFPWAHKALLQTAFERVFHHAARHGLNVSTSMFFTDRKVRESYGKWVVHHMGCCWWLVVETVQLWWPLLAQSKKALAASCPVWWTVALVLLLCSLSWCRWKAIRAGNLEAMQWASLSVSLTMHVTFTPAWSSQPPSFFLLSWPYFLASMYGLRLGICLLQLTSELAPMAWLHSTRFALSLLTAMMVGVAINSAQRDLSDRVFQPLLLYYIAVGGLHWLMYWILRFLLESHRMFLYIRYLEGKKK